MDEEYIGRSLSYFMEAIKDKESGLYNFLVQIREERSKDLKKWESANTEFKLSSNDMDRGTTEIMRVVSGVLDSYDNDLFKLQEDEQNSSIEST